MGRVVLGVVALMTCLWSYAAPAHALPVPQAASCAGVWVVVDFGALGGTQTECAGSYSTGMAALRSAPLSTPTLDSGLVVKINGLPAVPNIQENYWSYWHATRQADGSYASWTYSSVGPSSYHPVAGGAEGWRYQPVAGGYVAPGALPPKQTATTQAPATTAAATTARATAGATKGATTAAAGQASQTAAATRAPDSPTASPSATDSTSATSTPVAIDSRTVGATVAPAAPTSTSTSSLLGGVIAILVIAAGAGGVLLWRKRAAAKG
jgi:hypothetical protein